GGLRNILAILPGSDPAVAAELVVVGAHYDHVGYGNSSNSNGPTGYIHNGADDNASGVAGLIELAEALGHLPVRPRRPILIAFWDGEEKGLLGSYHFLRVRPSPLASSRIVFSVNVDMIGRLRGDRLEVFGTRTAEGLRMACLEANAATNLELVFDWEITDDSDHYPFIAANIPTVMFHTGLHDQYHRPSDDTHLVNFAGMEPVIRMTLDFVGGVADDPRPPRPFRSRCRGESAATRRALEMPAGDVATAGPRPRWGIGTRGDPGEPGAPIVVRVTAGAPMARAGVLLGDRIVAIDGLPIADQKEMVARLQDAGSSVLVEVDRRGRRLRFEAVSDREAAVTDP
ncbi:MAG: M20/M25/M40 family metallo-hydrolase, partial [Planctomycetia bacterium]|nr:M20/M25/M40 family metallo-hydrolase [Planctomycetia bacterium]